MDMQQDAVARMCLERTYNDTMSFPEGMHALAEAGFEGYHVDYRLNTRTCFLSSGEALVLAIPHEPETVGAMFHQPEIAAAVAWAQRNPPDYSYVDFSKRVTANGCAGYIMSIAGRRVLYYGRTAETHVEHFPR